MPCGEMLRGEKKLGESCVGWWGWGVESCPSLLGIKTNASLSALLEQTPGQGGELGSKAGMCSAGEMLENNRAKLQTAEKGQQSEL